MSQDVLADVDVPYDEASMPGAEQSDAPYAETHTVTVLCSQCSDVLGVSGTGEVTTDSRACNVVGCCLLGLSHVLSLQRRRVHGKRLLVGVGQISLCGCCCRLTGTALTLELVVVMQRRSQRAVYDQ